MKKLFFLITLFTGSVPSVIAQQETDSIKGVNYFDLSLEQLLNIDVIDKFKLYGFINSNVEKTFRVPSIGPDGKTIYTDSPLEWFPVKNFHIYGSSNLNDRISVLFNLGESDNDGIEISNAWGNMVINSHLEVRVGKMYRPFGLYNEKLDQIPTFTGIEAPELFDVDHLFLTRTTAFMLHGKHSFPKGYVRYSLTTGNSEGGAIRKVRPLGWDLRYKSNQQGIIIGTSGYTSSLNNRKSPPSLALGNGSPRGGILPWMAGDRFTVFGGFIEKSLGNFFIQSEFWDAIHNVIRDPEGILTLVKEAGINPRQRRNFLGNSASKPDSLLDVSDVVTNTSYIIRNFYLRLSYNFQTQEGRQIVPYLFFDWMSNPEEIRNKEYGGDNETGLTDDGKFMKPSIGVMYRPLSSVAIKLDASYHQQKFNGKTEIYPEIRLDFSYSFDAL